MGRPVYKYTNDGNFICKYQSTTQAARDLRVDESTIRRAADTKKKACGFIWTRYKVNEEQEIKKPVITPKILILDIETSPCLAYVWQNQVWKARINDEQIYSQWYILTYSCKWLGDKTMHSGRLTGIESLNENDERLVKELWFYLSEADVVIAHNGSKFDIPNIQTRFIVHGFPPTSSFKQIDTLRVAQSQFGFTHNSLDALAKLFGIERKISTSFDLWKRCLFGDEQALQEMETYNQHDVVMLEELYLRLRPYIKGHPNYNLYNDSKEAVCSHCGSTNLKLDGYYYFTQTCKYENYRCLDCGALSRGRKTILPKDKQMLISNGQ
jgi:DNA polymerase elongation subunit (family B)